MLPPRFAEFSQLRGFDPNADVPLITVPDANRDLGPIWEQIWLACPYQLIDSLPELAERLMELLPTSPYGGFRSWYYYSAGGKLDPHHFSVGWETEAEVHVDLAYPGRFDFPDRRLPEWERLLSRDEPQFFTFWYYRRSLQHPRKMGGIAQDMHRYIVNWIVTNVLQAPPHAFLWSPNFGLELVGNLAEDLFQRPLVEIIKTESTPTHSNNPLDLPPDF